METGRLLTARVLFHTVVRLLVHWSPQRFEMLVLLRLMFVWLTVVARLFELMFELMFEFAIDRLKDFGPGRLAWWAG